MVQIKVTDLKVDYSIDGVAIDICSEATSAIETLLGVISQTIDRPFEETVEFVTGVIKMHKALTEDE